MINDLTQTGAFAPATTSNLAVGFDILGFALTQPGDEVWLRKRQDNALVIQSIDSAFPLPSDSTKNTASVAIAAMQQGLNCSAGFDITIKKGIALGSGLGGSAASSVAAVVAFNQFLVDPLPLADLIPYALAGEQAATDSIHADNVIPSLLGGMICIHAIEPLSITVLPSHQLWGVFVRPDVVIETKQARAVLPEQVPLPKVIESNARLAAFIAALYTHDMHLLAQACRDELIEPHRQGLIPYFSEVQQAALTSGALGCSISGAGPTIFALCEDEIQAKQTGACMAAVYEAHQMDYELIFSQVSASGARSL